MRWWAAELALIALLSSASSAHAQRGGAPHPESHDRLEQERRTERHGVPERSTRRPESTDRGEPTTPERALPDYDGRADPAPTAGERLLWIPRILLFPLWATTEFLLRRPLSALMRWAEHLAADAKPPTNPLRFFVFDEGRVQLIPTLLVDFGNRPSVGFYVRWNEAGHPNHHLRFHFAFWGPDWVKGRATRTSSRCSSVSRAPTRSGARSPSPSRSS
jgi:hypothetical protein